MTKPSAKSPSKSPKSPPKPASRPSPDRSPKHAAQPEPGWRRIAAAPYFAALLAAVALTGLVTLSAPGNAALQAAMELAGLGEKSALERERQRQAAVIANLDGMISSMSMTLADLAQKAQTSATQDDKLSARIAELDRELGSLRQQIARQDLAQDLARQDAALRGSITDIAALRQDFEQSRNAHEASIASLERRLAQVERTLGSREVTSSVARKRVRRVRTVKRTPPPPPVISEPLDIMSPVID